MKKEIYTFADGRGFSYTEIPTNFDPDNVIERLIRINIPNSQWSEDEGFGEGMWVIVGNDTLTEWRKEASSGVHFASTYLNSFYFQKLKEGSVIPIKMKGGERPVAIYKELVDKFGEPNYTGRPVITSLCKNKK
jgi:hypothetical protein